MDIKSLFGQLDRLSKRKNLKNNFLQSSYSDPQHHANNEELIMLKYCKEAVDLHRKIYQ